jgi:hypothetical protein
MDIRFIISVVVLFVWTMLVGFVIHSYLLGADYAALPNLFRPEEDAQNYMSYMLIAHLSMAIGLTWIYRMGKENKPGCPGVRFGIAWFSDDVLDVPDLLRSAAHARRVGAQSAHVRVDRRHPHRHCHGIGE